MRLGDGDKKTGKQIYIFDIADPQHYELARKLMRPAINNCIRPERAHALDIGLDTLRYRYMTMLVHNLSGHLTLHMALIFSNLRWFSAPSFLFLLHHGPDPARQLIYGEITYPADTHWERHHLLLVQATLLNAGCLHKSAASYDSICLYQKIFSLLASLTTLPQEILAEFTQYASEQLGCGIHPQRVIHEATPGFFSAQIALETFFATTMDQKNLLVMLGGLREFLKLQPWLTQDGQHNQSLTPDQRHAQAEYQKWKRKTVCELELLSENDTYDWNMLELCAKKYDKAHQQTIFRSPPQATPFHRRTHSDTVKKIIRNMGTLHEAEILENWSTLNYLIETYAEDLTDKKKMTQLLHEIFAKKRLQYLRSSIIEKLKSPEPEDQVNPASNLVTLLTAIEKDEANSVKALFTTLALLESFLPNELYSKDTICQNRDSLENLQIPNPGCFISKRKDTLKKPTKSFVSGSRLFFTKPPSDTDQKEQPNTSLSDTMYEL